MKPATLLLCASVAANAALLAAFAVKPSLAPPAIRDFFRGGNEALPLSGGVIASDVTASTASQKTTPRTQAQLWQALDSADLPTLISRLRAAGFSPTVIRGIVSAQLEARSAARLEALVATADTSFWKASHFGMTGNAKLYEEMNQINRERTRLMRELLGDDFFASAGSDPNTAQRRRYGDIPKHKIELVQRIADDYSEMMSQVRTAAQGMILPEDREKLALLERERRADLASVLTPQELEEFEMRSSVLTNRLRATMSFMDASEDEFRAIFRVYQPVAEIVFPTGGVISPSGMDERRDAQQKVFEQIKATLGEPRFSEFARANNPEYQQLARLAQNENIPQDNIVRAFALRDTASVESNRIFDDKSIDTEQKRVALKALAEQTRAQAVSILGAKNADSYLKNANWFSALERGGSFSFRFDGGTSRMRTLPPVGRGPGAPPMPSPPSTGTMILN